MIPMDPPNYPTDCQKYRRAWQLGILARDRLRQWVEHWIEVLPEPPYPLLELATCVQPAQILTLLNQLCADQSPQAVGPLLLPELAHYWQAHPSQTLKVWQLLAQVFYQESEGWSQEQQTAFYSLDEGFDLLPAGYTTLPELEAELCSFLG